MKRRFKYLLLLCAVLVCSCAKKSADNVPDFVAKVGTKTLTTNDLQDIFAAAAVSSDSAVFVKNYLEKWAAAELLFDKARKQLDDDKEIEKLVEEYRKTLIINSFKRKILNDNKIEPTKEEIVNYYNQNKSALKLEEPIVKGALLLLPKNSPQTEQLRSAMKKLDNQSIEKIEKYSLQHAVNYKIFTYKWLSFSEISQLAPIPQSNKDAFVSAKNFYELNDSVSTCFLSIKEFRLTGAETPLENVNTVIINILTTQKSLQFVKDYQKKLYDNAVKKGEVVFK